MSNPYEAALVEPFNPKAYGARVPDAHSIPTNIYSVRQIWEIAVNNPAGNFDFMVTPCPYDTVITSLQQDGGSVLLGPNVKAFGSAIPTAIGTAGSAVPVGYAKYGEGPGQPPAVDADPTPIWSGTSAGITTPESLSNFLADYRVVSFGCRVRSLLPALQQSGSMLYGSQPAPPIQPPTEYSSYDEWLNLTDYPAKDPVTGVLSSSMINLPIHDTGSYAELTQEGGMEWTSRICGPGAFKFRDTQVSGFLTQNYSTAGSGSNFLLTTSAPGSSDLKWGADIGSDSADFTQVIGSVGGAVEINPTGVSLVESRGLDPYNTDGWTTLFVRGSGVGVVTGVAPPTPAQPVSVIQIEVVFHLEGTAAVVNNSLVAGASVGVYENAKFVRAVERASRERWFKRVVDYDDRPHLSHSKGSVVRKKRVSARKTAAFPQMIRPRMRGKSYKKRKH